jgi:hypothetical protein
MVYRENNFGAGFGKSITNIRIINSYNVERQTLLEKTIKNICFDISKSRFLIGQVKVHRLI